jgi:hypothetical protein
MRCWILINFSYNDSSKKDRKEKKISEKHPLDVLQIGKDIRKVDKNDKKAFLSIMKKELLKTI